MAVFNRADPCCESAQMLSDKLMNIFDPVAPDVESMFRLASLAQGFRPLLFRGEKLWCTSAMHYLSSPLPSSSCRGPRSSQN